MTLLRRITRFMKADLHGLLDGLEEPQEMLKQTIRDMEEALEHKARTLETLQARLHSLQTEKQEVERIAQEIDHHIDLCFEARHETLARGFIRKRLVIIQQSRQLKRSFEEIQSQYTVLERTIQEQRHQLATVVQQLNLYTAQAGSPPSYPAGGSGTGVSEDDVEVAFLEEKRRRTQHSQTTV